MSSADTFILDKSLDTFSSRSPFIDKRVLYINDSNNASYNGQIVFDSTSLANSGQWLDYSGATLQIPLVISMRSSIDITTTANAYIAGLKAGTQHLIDSIQVDYNNSNVVQLQSFTNFHVGYKVLTSWSQDEGTKFGPLTFNIKDTPDSWRYSPTGASVAYGVGNNVPFDDGVARTYTSASSLSPYNDGFGERIKLSANPAGGYAGLGIMTTSGQNDLVGKAYFTNDGGSAAARIYSWKILATIRLKDVSDFFAKLPLVRGAQIRLTVNYNASRVALTCDGAGLNVVQSSLTMLAGRTVPFMLASGAAQQPLNTTLALGAQTITMECNVMTASTPAASASSLMSSCRLYVSGYVMNPVDEMKYISLGQKVVEYDDLYGYIIQGVSGGSSFNSIVTNGIVNPQKLVVIPMLSPTAGNNVTGASLQQFQSVFDSAPATTCPVGALTQFNVLVSGKQILQSNQQYDFDAFVNEVAQANALTGGQASGLMSGLLSMADWSNGYRYYVVDIARRLESEDSIPKSVQVSGINDTSKSLDLYVFVSYKRKIVLDLASGAIVSM